LSLGSIGYEDLRYTTAKYETVSTETLTKTLAHAPNRSTPNLPMPVSVLTVCRLALAAIGTYLATLPLRSAPASVTYGNVTFANSGSTAAQADFLEGLALLHNFEYPSAALAFRRAQAADPGFALAYWGEAMTFNHAVWMEQDLPAAREALAHLASSPAERRAKAKTEREKAYLDAVELLYGEGSKLERDVRYANTMAELHKHYPTDIDGTAFYALALLGTTHGGRDPVVYMRAAALLEEIWPDHREHPGLLHYLIHCYDDPTHAPLGLRMARLYGWIAPNAPHALHMTSHIFLALGMWQETVDANVAAIAVRNRQLAAKGRAALNWGHYPSWLAYAYLQLGKTNEALQTLAACHSQPESGALPNGGGNEMDPDRNRTASFANMRLAYLLDTGDWQGEPAQWTVPSSAGSRARLDIAFANTLAPIALGKAAVARAALSGLEAICREVTNAVAKQAKPDPTDRLRPEIMQLEARGLLTELEGDPLGAESLLRQAVAEEETLPVAFGPPTIDKPTHELLGQFLLRHGRKREARVLFQAALARAPGRRLAQEGLTVSSVGLPPLVPGEDYVTRPLRSAQIKDPICGLGALRD
jgi:tetratricopeptide (TPR) repeat protein